MITTLIIFTIANIVLAWLDANKIIKGTTINHAINGAIYVAMVAIPYFIFHNYFLIGALLFNRLLVFNIALSLFRELEWDYISTSPISIVDKLAKLVFGMNGKLMYAVYLIIFVAFVICTFLVK